MFRLVRVSVFLHRSQECGRHETRRDQVTVHTKFLVEFLLHMTYEVLVDNCYWALVKKDRPCMLSIV